MSAPRVSHETPIPRNIPEILAILQQSPNFDILVDILSSIELTRVYYDAIGTVDQAINSHPLDASPEAARARGALLFLVFHRLARPDAAIDYAQLKSIAIDEDFAAFLVYFHNIPENLHIKVLEFHAVGTTSLIFRVQSQVYGQCALKVIQAQYMRLRSILAATKAYEVQSRELSPAYSPTVHESASTWILMEFLDGPNLAEFMNRLRQHHADRTSVAAAHLSEMYLSTVTKILNKIAEAMSYYELKKNPVVHGDLTPYNIIISGSIDDPVAVKLFDFGPNYILKEQLGKQRGIFEITQVSSRPKYSKGDALLRSNRIYIRSE